MLIRYRKILMLLALCLNGIIYAQDKDLHGLVLVDFRNIYPEGVLITNTRTNTYSISDMSGSFHIAAQLGDTLMFQGDYLISRKLVVRKSTFELDPFIVHLNYEIITLADVIVKPPLTGDLKKDMKTVKIRDDIEKVYANLGIDIRTLDMEPKEKKAPIIPKIGPIPIPVSLNVEALYKTFTGYYRRMENLNQFERLEKRLIDVKEHLGISYFKETIGIAEEDIRGFLLYVYDHSENHYEQYYLQSDYLSMDTLLQQHAKEFKDRLKTRDAKMTQDKTE